MNKVFNLVMIQSKRFTQLRRLIITIGVTCVTVMYFLLLVISNMMHSIELLASESDQNQMTEISVLFIVVAAITIVFFAWVFGIIYQQLVHKRKEDILKLRLIGTQEKEIVWLYIQECLRITGYVIIIGGSISTIVGIILYLVMHMKPEPLLFLYSVIMYIIVISFTLIKQIISMRTGQIISEIRGSNQVKKHRKLGILSIIEFVLGSIVAGFTLLIILIIRSEIYTCMFKLFYIVAFVLCYDVINYCIHKFILAISKAIKSYNGYLIEKLYMEYYKEIKAASLMICFSICIFMSLETLYYTARQMALETVEKNIHFEEYIQYDKLRDIPEQIPEENKAFYTIYLTSRNIYGYDNKVFAVNKFFLQNYEHLEFNYKKKKNSSKWAEMYGLNLDGYNMGLEKDLGITEEVMEQIDNEDWDGILVSQLKFGSEGNKIGDKKIVKIDGKELEFTVRGAFYDNTFFEKEYYVGQAYVKKKLGLDSKFNIAFFMNKSDAKLLADKESSHIRRITREKIGQDSYSEVIKETEVIELIAVIIILCSFFMLINFFIMLNEENTMYCVKFRAMGMNNIQIYKFFICYVINIVVKISVFSITFSQILANTFCYMIIPSYYIPKGAAFLVWAYVGIFVGIGFLFTGFLLFLIKRINKKDFVNTLRSKFM